MSNETQPQPSPAALLAGVLAILTPDAKIVQMSNFLNWTRGGKGWLVYPDSIDDLARVVAMLDGAQRERFDDEAENLWGERTEFATVRPSASKTLLATPAQILAAIVAATGVKA